MSLQKFDQPPSPPLCHTKAVFTRSLHYHAQSCMQKSTEKAGIELALELSSPCAQ